MAPTDAENDPLNTEENEGDPKVCFQFKTYQTFVQKRGKLCAVSVLILGLSFIAIFVFGVVCILDLACDCVHVLPLSNNHPSYASYLGSDLTFHTVLATEGLLIDTDVCLPDTCFTCTTDVPREYVPYDENKKCSEESNGNIVNGSCYFCNDSCFTEEDLSKMKSISCEKKKDVTINCCLLARMSSLLGGNYQCFNETVHKKYNRTGVIPLRICAYGKKGEQCDEPNKEAFICKCYTYMYKFNRQKEIPDCYKTPRKRSEIISECTTKAFIDGKNLKCFCTNKEEIHHDTIKSCGTVPTG